MTNFGIFPRDQKNNEAVSDAADQLKDVEPVINENEAFESFRAGTPNDQERFGDTVKDETEVSKQNLIQKISEKLKNSANSKKNIARAAIAAVAMAGTVALLANCGRVNDDNNQPGNSVDIEDQNDQIDLDDEFDNNNGGNITVDIDDDGNVTIDHGNGEIVDGGVDGDIDVIDDNENGINPEDYIEGDIFHFDEYMEALGFTFDKPSHSFAKPFRVAGGSSLGYASVKMTPDQTTIEFHDIESGRTVELIHNYHGVSSDEHLTIELNDSMIRSLDKSNLMEQLDGINWVATEEKTPLEWESTINTDNSSLPGFDYRS